MTLANATRSEITKQFTTAGWWVLAIVLFVYVVFTAGVMALAIGVTTHDAGVTSLDSNTAATLYGIAATAGYVIPLLFGTLMVTTEFRHALVIPTFLATPKRSMSLVAKIIAGVIMGLLYGAVAIIASVATVAIVLSLFGVDTGLGDSEVLLTIARSVLAMILWVLVGIGVGSVIRNQVAAIVVVLAFTMFVEQLLRLGGMLLEWLGEFTKWLPGAASDALVGHSLFSASLSGSTTAGEPLTWWMGGVVLLGYAVVLTAIGALTTWRRDVS